MGLPCAAAVPLAHRGAPLPRTACPKAACREISPHRLRPPRAAWQNPDDKSEDVFILGALVSTDTDKEVSKVRIKAGGAEVQVRATDISPANPAGLTAPDNCMLIHLSEATLLENVRARYFTKEIYTLTGSILLAMNPFETLPIYSEAQMEPYKGKPLGKAPAHVYGTAECAYQLLSRTKQPQSIVVSGAGKELANPEPNPNPKVLALVLILALTLTLTR